MRRREAWHRRGILIALPVLLAGLSGWLLQTATATVTVTAQTTFYASPTGSGNACTSSAPCSLAGAKSAVEAATSNMTQDLTVVLEAGTYRLGSPLTFDALDSGRNGHTVVYEAMPGQSVVLSGGLPVTGWTLHEKAKNVYQASVPAGFNTRQLYVNGRRATVAKAAASAVFGTMTTTSTGFTYTAAGPNSWTSTGLADVEYATASGLHKPTKDVGGAGWQDVICPVASVSGNAVTEQAACFSKAVSEFGLAMPTAVENNYALLGSPGQFFLDTAIHTIYYIPRPGEDMSSAAVVAASPQPSATQQALVEVGTPLGSHVHNLRFTGLSFEYATWLFDSTGVQDGQADFLAGNAGPLPASVACHHCDDVTFSRDVFEHLGGSGLSFDGGGSNDTVIGNVITDVAGNGVEIGGASADIFETSDTVNDNYVHDVANQYPGGIGIVASYVSQTSVDHNEVWDTPYTGISLGDWTSTTMPMADNNVDDNYVHHVMTSWLYDGGAIYVLGAQSKDGPSDMQGNHVDQISNSKNIGALYLDGGSSFWMVKNNVVGGYEPHWLFVQNGDHESEQNTVTSNYIGAEAGPVNGVPPAGNLVEDNVTGLTTWPTAAQTTISGAGLESAYVGIRSGMEQQNLAYGQPAVASSSEVGYPASGANDGHTTTPWVSATGAEGGWWQTDLGASYSLSDIQILFRQDGPDNPAEREGLQIWVSNTAEMANGHTVACTVGAIPLPYESRYDCDVPAGTWRYVAVVKTDTSHFALGQVRVFGSR